MHLPPRGLAAGRGKARGKRRGAFARLWRVQRLIPRKDRLRGSGGSERTTLLLWKHRKRKTQDVFFSSIRSADLSKSRSLATGPGRRIGTAVADGRGTGCAIAMPGQQRHLRYFGDVTAAPLFQRGKMFFGQS